MMSKYGLPIAIVGGNWEPLVPIAKEILDLLKTKWTPEVEYLDDGSFGFRFRGYWVEMFNNTLRITDKRGAGFKDLLVVKGAQIRRIRRETWKRIVRG